MSITDELMAYVTNNSLHCFSDYLAIADRIDAEHEKAMSRAGQLLADAEKDRDYKGARAESGGVMAAASFKVEFPRRQAMLSIRKIVTHWPKDQIDDFYQYDDGEIARVPVFVWPMPTQDGYFIVEHQDGTAQRVQPDSLTFLGSKQLFDQYDWSKA